MTRTILFVALFFSLYPAKTISQVSFSGTPTKGCGSLTVQFTYTGSEVPGTMLWRFGNGDTSHRVTPLPVSYDSPGMYDVSLSVNGGTPVVESQFIKVREVPAAGFVYSDTLAPGSFNYIFRAAVQPVDSASYTYEWTFRDDSTTAGTPRVLHQYATSGMYPVRLIVTDDFGCADTATRMVNVSEKVQMPNVFTPNGDGINDRVSPAMNGITTYDFKIYSRYGILLYKTVSKFPEWDGKNTAGVEMYPGVYYYTLESLDPEHPLSQSGFIHLFK
ncbi:MAG: PKD domain-containing protein [Bacteroidales bacterium]